MTHKEIFEALLAGKKVRHEAWSPNCFIILNDDGEIRDELNSTMGAFHTALRHQSGWEIYQEPKKKVVRWLWANPHGVVTTVYKSEEESRGQWPIKLEWSRQEFEV